MSTKLNKVITETKTNLYIYFSIIHLNDGINKLSMEIVGRLVNNSLKKLLKITLPYFVSVQYKEPDIHQCLLL